MTSVWPRRAEAVAEQRGGGSASSSDSASSSRSSGGDADLVGEHLGLGEEERQHRHALLALRAERPEVAVAGEDPDLVEVRAEPGRAALEVARQAVVEGDSRDGGSAS